MNDAEIQSIEATTLLAAEPQLFVSDFAVACAFYTGKLGFMVAFTYGSPPFYGQVVRDGARLNLHCVTPPVRLISSPCSNDPMQGWER